MKFNDKNIKQLETGKIKDEGTGLYVRVGGTTVKVKSIYLYYKVKGVSQHKKIGEWAPVGKSDPDKKIFTVDEARVEASNIKHRARTEGSDKVLMDKLTENYDPNAKLKDKLKIFFERALFTRAQLKAKVGLKWYNNRKNLTYLPVRGFEESKALHYKKKRLGKAKLPKEPEPRYRDKRFSNIPENKDKYPHIEGKDHYWAYVGLYNNFIVPSKVMVKPLHAKQGPYLMNCPYHAIPKEFFKELHIEAAQKGSERLANDVLEMLRVFYNTLIEDGDPQITSNPVSKGLSRPTKGLQQSKIDTEGEFWFDTPPKEKDVLTNKQIDSLRDAIESEIIQDPQSFNQRAYNRTLLFIYFRLYTGVRPDVSKYLKWSMIEGKNQKKNNIPVQSKSMVFNLNIELVREVIFDRIIELKSREPDHPYIFAGYDSLGAQVGMYDIRKTWKKITKLANIPQDWKFYNLKHTAITVMMRLLSNNVTKVSKVTGVSVTTLLKYYVQEDPEQDANKTIQEFFEKPKLVVSN